MLQVEITDDQIVQTIRDCKMHFADLSTRLLFLVLLTLGSHSEYFKVENCWPNLWTTCFITQIFYACTFLLKARVVVDLVVE